MSHGCLKKALLLSVAVWLCGCVADESGASPSPGVTSTQQPHAALQHIGLPVHMVLSGSTPPLGDGVAPLSGTGGDGAPAVLGKGIAEGAPGAIRWYGGQWLMSYAGTPGATIANASCDIISNASSTDTIELVGAAGVIATVPVTGNGTFRAWMMLSYTIAPGEVLVFRHSPRNTATGSWTSGVEQMTVLSCAVNAVTQYCNLSVNYASTTSPSLGIVSTANCDPASGNTGALSVTFGGQTISLGAWNPVCGTKPGISLGLNFGTATFATFTLAISSPTGSPVTTCSSVLAVRPQ